MTQTAENIEQTTSPDMSIYAPKDIPIESIIEYKKKGMSTREIGKLVGCTHSNVVKRLQSISEDIDTLDSYKLHRADILAFNGRKLLNHITEEKLQKAPVGTLVLAACQLYDKERLERGESTHNIASIHGDIQELKALKHAQKHKMQDGDA